MSAADEDLDADADLLKAIAHGTRLQILSALQGAERAVGEIETMTGIAQPGLSQQLGVLRKAELVATRREGKQVFYSVSAQRMIQVRRIVDGLMPAGEEVGEPDVAADPIRRRGGAAVFARITD